MPATLVAPPARLHRPHRRRPYLTYISLYLPTSPYISLHLPTSTYISQYLQALGAEAGARLAAAVGASSIREIDLDGEVLQLDVLRGEEAAEHIDLEATRLEPIASAVVAACLRANRVASSLRVRTRDLSLTSCATLAEAVRGHPSLTSVDLDGAALPVHQLSGLSPAASLALQARGLGPNSALLVATCMRANTALRSLDLSCNELGPHGAASLGEALRGNTVLTTLRLASNGLGREGGIALASNLPSSPLTLSLTLT